MKPTRYKSKSKIRQRSINLTFLLILCGGIGLLQAQLKEQYSSALDSLWSNDTNILKMAKDGNWIALAEDFSKGGSEILLMQTQGHKKYLFSAAEFLNFSADTKWFGCIIKKELIIINLVSDEETRYSNITNYSFSNDGKYIAAQQQGAEELNTLLIIDLNKQIEKRLSNVNKFKWHPFKNVLLVKAEEEEQIQVLQYDVGKGITQTLFEENTATIEHLEWNDSGTAAIFLSEREGINTINYYEESQGILKSLSDIHIHEKFTKYKISDREPFASNDGTKIIFYLQANNIDTILNSDAQVWDVDDPWIEPQMERYRKRVEQYFLTAWYPESGEIKAIETEGLHTAAMGIDHDYALVYDQLQYEPLYKLYPNADLYIKNH